MAHRAPARPTFSPVPSSLHLAIGVASQPLLVPLPPSSSPCSLSPFWLGGTWGPMCHSGATLDLEMRRPGELANNTNTRGFPQVWTPLQKKQDARAFKYMSEATINTSCFILKLFFFWVEIVRLGWELSVLGGNCPSWVGIVRLGWEFSV